MIKINAYAHCHMTHFTLQRQKRQFTVSPALTLVEDRLAVELVGGRADDDTAVIVHHLLREGGSERLTQQDGEPLVHGGSDPT